MLLLDRVAVISGGTSGIGLAAAQLFVRHGAYVLILGRDAERGAQSAGVLGQIRPGAAEFAQVDVTDAGNVERVLNDLVRRQGRLDVVFSNAGSNEPHNAIDTTVESWYRVIDSNLSSHFFMAKYSLPHLVARGGGSVIFTSSEFGLVGGRNKVAYCAAKGGLHNMTRQLAVDYAASGVRVNCLAPGAVRTPMLMHHIRDEHEDPVAFERAQVAPILLGRFGEPTEIANVALFLASDMSSYLTGTTIVADGGVTAWYGV